MAVYGRAGQGRTPCGKGSSGPTSARGPRRLLAQARQATLRSPRIGGPEHDPGSLAQENGSSEPGRLCSRLPGDLVCEPALDHHPFRGQ